MEIRSDRRYRFDVAPAALWEAIAATDGYQRWWPWLRRLDAGGLVEGDVWQCTVQPPFPYVLRFAVHLDDVVEPAHVDARVSGDVEGRARLEIRPDGTGCEARLTSWLAPRNGMLRVVAATARPVVRFGHDWVLDTGARQFRARGLGG